MSEVTLDQMKVALLGQESSGGKADTTQANYATARGPMQVTEDTFNGLKKNGVIPAEWNHATATQAQMQTAGNRLVDGLWSQFGGDPQKVAAAYYAGPKAVQADGTIHDYRDLKNSKAPSTLQYVDQVMGRLGAKGSPLPYEDGDAVEPPEAHNNVLAAWDVGMPDKTAVVRSPGKGGGVPPVSIQAPPQLTGTEVPPLSAQYEKSDATNREEVKQADDQTFLDTSRSAFMGTFAGSAIRKIALSQFEEEHKPDPAWHLDPKELGGYDSSEQEFLQQAGSADQFARIKWEIEDRRDTNATINRKGTGYGIAASLFAGLPEGYLLGMGAMRALQLARGGSAQLAAQGYRMSAVASGLAENVGANVGLTAIQSKFDPYVGKADYAMALGGSLVGFAAGLPHVWADAGRGELATAARRMQEASAKETMTARQKAYDNLGPDATDAQYQQEVQRLEGNQVRQTLSEYASEQVPNGLKTFDPAAEAEKIVEKIKEDNLNKANDEGRKRFDQQLSESQRLERETWEANSKGQQVEPLVSRVLEEEKDLPAQEAKPPVWERTGGYNVGENPPKGVKMDEGTGERVTYKPESTRDILSKIVERGGEDSPRGVMAARLLEQMKEDIPFYRMTKADLSKHGRMSAKDARSYYEPNDHYIAFDKDANEDVVLHEVEHALTVQKIHYGLSNPETAHGQLTTQIDSMLTLARTEFKAQRPALEAAGADTHLIDYLLQNHFEFTAGLYGASNDSYANFLHSIKLPGQDVSLLSRFVSTVRKLLGMAPDEESVFSRSLGLSDKLKDTPLDTTFKGRNGKTLTVHQAPAPNRPWAEEMSDLLNSKTVQENGLGLMPQDTPIEQAELRGVAEAYEKANAFDKANGPINEKRLSSLTNTAIFKGAQATANVMLRSKNPVVRWVAATLLESPGGAGGRRATASIQKHMNEKAYMGNTLNDYQASYEVYRKAQGETVIGDFFKGKTREQFDRMVAEEIESRRPGAAKVESPPAVKAGADHLEAAYERIRTAQVNQKTIGWGALPENSVGYMPHKMSPEKVANMTSAQANALHSALTDQFVANLGYDMTFADHLASKYVDRVRVRAMGGFDAPIGMHQTGAADLVQEALEQMGMTRQEINAQMKRYMAGGMTQTKQRLQLDLLASHDLGDGKSFQLMDLFETDQNRLLRTQAMRVAGEVALARFGVMGKPGMKLLRRAMEFGADGQKAQGDELKAFDQVTAEFFGDPFGTQSKFVDRAMQVNSLARLGGMGFTQFGEAINGIFSVGAMRTLSAIGDMGRLRQEILALARGEKVDNPILSSIEQFGGAEFGTDSYKTVFPFDNQSLAIQTYGKETVNAADRLLRGGQYLNGKLSMWQTIHSTQHRGFAEQIVRKAAQYMHDGKSGDAALKDMGLTDEVLSALRKDLPNIAEFEGGKLTNFDLSKATDQEAALAFTQAIHRGTSQIIQGTFTGETGAWAHDGVMRLMTQFRTFSLTSVEKQWARQVGNVGEAKAMGMMIGAMSLAAPLYMARTYLASIGRSDQQAYLDKQLTSAQIARASLNYISMSGLAGDFLDATTAITGIGKVTGGRAAAATDFGGNVVAPSAGLANDVWKGLQNTKEGTDPHELLKSLPFSRLPFLIPAINALGN